MTIRLIFTQLLLLLSVAACSPRTRITAAPSPEFHLSDFKTFAFYDVEASGSGLNEDYESKISMLQEEIAQQLQARGLEQVSESPDLLVNIGVVVEEKIQTRETNFRTDAPIYIGQRRYTWKSQEVPVRRYKTGTVSLEMIDSGLNALVWHGAAEGILPDKTKRLREQVQQGIQDLISRVPQ